MLNLKQRLQNKHRVHSIYTLNIRINRSIMLSNYSREASEPLWWIGTKILGKAGKDELEKVIGGMSKIIKNSNHQETALFAIGDNREEMITMLGKDFFMSLSRYLTKLTMLKDGKNGEVKRHAIATLAIINSKDEDEDMTDAAKLETTSISSTTNTTSDSTAAVESSDTAGSGDNAVELEDFIKKLQSEVPPSFKDFVYEWVTSVSKMWELFETVAAKETMGMKSLDASNHVQKLKKVLMKSPTEHEDLAKIKKDVTDPVFHKITKQIDNLVEETQDPSILGDELAKKMKIAMKDSIMNTLLMHAYIPVE